MAKPRSNAPGGLYAGREWDFSKAEPRVCLPKGRQRRFAANPDQPKAGRVACVPADEKSLARRLIRDAALSVRLGPSLA